MLHKLFPVKSVYSGAASGSGSSECYSVILFDLCGCSSFYKFEKKEQYMS